MKIYSGFNFCIFFFLILFSLFVIPFKISESFSSPDSNEKLTYHADECPELSSISDDDILTDSELAKILQLNCHLGFLGTYHGYEIIGNYFCSDVCPEAGRIDIIYNNVTKEKCDEIGGIVKFDYAWGGYIGCTPSIHLQVEELPSLVPDWFKNNALWWTQNRIDDKTFANGIHYLLKEGIVVIPPVESGQVTYHDKPYKIKENTELWSQDKLPDWAFFDVLKYLISRGLIIVDW